MRLFIHEMNEKNHSLQFQKKMEQREKTVKQRLEKEPPSFKNARNGHDIRFINSRTELKLAEENKQSEFSPG